MKLNQRGQALIELIIFLPLMFMLYSVITGYANAINGSINQQKITRAYFYYRAQNNSTIPKPDADQGYMNWGRFGMFFIGWKDYFQGRTPVHPCYRVSIPLSAGAADNCTEKYTRTTTQYIRVGTVYGVCGGTYTRIDQTVAWSPDYNGGRFEDVTDKTSCLISR